MGYLFTSKGREERGGEKKRRVEDGRGTSSFALGSKKEKSALVTAAVFTARHDVIAHGIILLFCISPAVRNHVRRTAEFISPDTVTAFCDTVPCFSSVITRLRLWLTN